MTLTKHRYHQQPEQDNLDRLTPTKFKTTIEPTSTLTTQTKTLTRTYIKPFCGAGVVRFHGRDDQAGVELFGDEGVKPCSSESFITDDHLPGADQMPPLDEISL